MKPKAETTAVPLAVIGVDIGKDVFHLVGLSVDGKIAFKKKIGRLGLRDDFEKLPPCIVGVETSLGQVRASGRISYPTFAGAYRAAA